MASSKPRFYQLILASLLLAFAGLVGAQDHVIGYVDATKVFEQSPQYEAARQALESEFARRDSDLVAQQKQLKQLQDKLTQDGALMSDAEAKNLERDIVARRRQLKSAQDAFREDFNLRRNDEFNKLRRIVAEVVKEVGKEKGIDMIFTDGVVYASKRVDISDLILERLKDKFNASNKQ
jgi:outer membrane protein